MPVINLTTFINAPIERCFDLSRSIDLHQATTSKTNEKAIDGITKGLISKGETVTWEATHFWVRQKLKTLISEMDSPVSFVDVQLEGAFKKLHHLHTFEQQGQQTIMKDAFEFESPMGFLGQWFNTLVLTNYMTGFLTERNRILKRVAESDEWKKYLDK